jgi:hypothetical protein
MRQLQTGSPLAMLVLAIAFSLAAVPAQPFFARPLSAQQGAEGSASLADMTCHS